MRHNSCLPQRPGPNALQSPAGAQVPGVAPDLGACDASKVRPPVSKHSREKGQVPLQAAGLWGRWQRKPGPGPPYSSVIAVRVPWITAGHHKACTGEKVSCGKSQVGNLKGPPGPTRDPSKSIDTHTAQKRWPGLPGEPPDMWDPGAQNDVMGMGGIRHLEPCESARLQGTLQ